MNAPANNLSAEKWSPIRKIMKIKYWISELITVTTLVVLVGT